SGRCILRKSQQSRAATRPEAVSAETKIGRSRAGERIRRKFRQFFSRGLRPNQRCNFFVQVDDRITKKNVRPGQPYPQSTGPRGIVRAVERAGWFAPPRSFAWPAYFHRVD